MRRHKSHTDFLPFVALRFDAVVQRSVMPARVKKLVREWNLDDVGIITVSTRHDRQAYVIDGQHRVRAAMEKGLGDTKVACHIYHDLSLEDEARKFLALNDSRSVSPFDRYKVGLVAQDPVCIGVRDTLKKHGLYITMSYGAEAGVKCVSRALTMYEDGPELLDDVCRILVETWGTRAAAFEQIVFSAMGMVVARYNGEMDYSILTKKLAGFRGGPAALAGDARGLADYKPISVTRAAAEIMVDTYNGRRRSGRLSPL